MRVRASCGLFSLFNRRICGLHTTIKPQAMFFLTSSAAARADTRVRPNSRYVAAKFCFHRVLGTGLYFSILSTTSAWMHGASMTTVR